MAYKDTSTASRPLFHGYPMIYDFLNLSPQITNINLPPNSQHKTVLSFTTTTPKH